MPEFLKRMQAAVSSAILIPLLYSVMFDMFIPSSYPILWELIYWIPVILLALHWLLFLIWKKIGRYESMCSFPRSLFFWLIPAASMLSTMLLIMHGRRMEPNLFIMGPMLIGFALMVGGTYLPGTTLRKPHRFIGNVWIWCGGITVFVSGLGHFYLYNILIGIMLILSVVSIFLHHPVSKTTKKE